MRKAARLVPGHSSRVPFPMKRNINYIFAITAINTYSDGGRAVHRKGGAMVALRIIEVASFILLRPGTQIKVSSLQNLRGPLYSNRPLRVFFYCKAHVLIISAIKAINSNRSQENAYALRKKGTRVKRDISLFSRGEILFSGYVCLKYAFFTY